MSRASLPLVALADGKGGCPEIIRDGPYRMRCSAGIDECARHGRFETVAMGPQAAAPDDFGPAPSVDEMEGHFIDANERMGEALVAIGMALGLPRPRVGATWGAPEILARIAVLHSEDRVETAARVLHDRRHRAGTAHTCDRCREDAAAVAAVLTASSDTGETP